MSLTSKDLVISYLQLEDVKPETEAQIERFVNVVDKRIENKTRRNQFESGSITEYHDGEGRKSFYTDEFPVTAVASLYDDIERNYTSGYLIDTDDYVWYADGRVELDGGTFSDGLKNIKITYTAGYSTIPADLVELATRWVAKIVLYRKNIGVSSISGADGSVTYFDRFLDAEMIATIEDYRDYRF